MSALLYQIQKICVHHGSWGLIWSYIRHDLPEIRTNLAQRSSEARTDMAMR
jgi:hypothetical protein